MHAKRLFEGKIFFPDAYPVLGYFLDGLILNYFYFIKLF